MTALTPSRQVTLLADLPQPSSAYKRRVWLAVAGLLTFMALYFVLAGWFVYTAYRLTAGAGSPAVEGWFVAFCSLFLAVMMLKPIFFVKHGGTDGSVEITEDEQPRLFAFLNALADTAEAPRPHRVFLAANVNAAVFYDLSALNLIFPSKKNLEIGLGLVNALTLGELRAVLAHEFGHFSQSSMAVIRWSYLAQQIAAHLVMRRDKLDAFLVRLSHWDVRVAWIGWLLSIIVWSIRSLVDSAFGVVVMLQRALSREMEFQADLVSVSLSGSDALIHALHRLQAADDSWDRTLGLVADQHSRGRIPRDVFALHTRIMERMGDILSDPGYGQVPPIPADNPEEHRLFKPELAQPPKMWLTHPLNHDREANAKQQYVAATIDDRSAWTLFDDPERIREQVSAAMIGPDAGEPVAIEDSLEALDAQFSREYFNSRYRGVYLGRSVVRGTDKVEALFDANLLTWRKQLDELYPEALVKDVTRLRAFEKELGQLRAIHAGVLAPAEGGIRHRGRVIKVSELPGAIERVEKDAEAVEKRLVAHDRVCRSVHLAAARQLGNGWPEYLEGLLATLHYADHTVSNIQDLHGLLSHTVHIATVTRRISSAGRKRVVAAANELQLALENVFVQGADVTLDTTLAQRLGNTSWTEILGKFELGAADEDNIGDWLNVVDGWVHQATGPMGALRTEALEQLLVTEAMLASHVQNGTPAEPAPSPSRMPAGYETLLTGKDRERKDSLNLWERFQIADGKVAAVARVAVAAGIVMTVLGFGGTIGGSTITVYNGLAIPVVVDIAGTPVTVAPLKTYEHQLAKAGVYPIASRTRDGKMIERFDQQIPGSFGRFVYNIGGAAPLIEWTATYGNVDPVPERMLGAPRWIRTGARILFDEPPDTIETDSKGGVRTVLSAASEPPPMRQLDFVGDSVEQRAMVESHVRWDPTNSEYILVWLMLGQERSPTHRSILERRIAEAPNDVVLLRAEQDASKGAAKDSVCMRHRARSEAAPDSGGLFYLALRCIPDSDAKTQAFIEGHAHWSDNPWLAYGAGYSLVEEGRWDEAIAALEDARKKLRPVARNVAVDVARLYRLTARDSGHAIGALIRSSPELEFALSLESGKDLDGTPAAAYPAMMRGDLEKALSIAHADSSVEAGVLRFAAASDGATPEMITRARALPTEAALDNDTRWAAIGLAMREGWDHKAFLPTEDDVSPQELQQLLRFVERARNEKDRAGAEEELRGMSLVMRGHAYSVATIVLGPATPAHWRNAARQILFASERPYFR
jgi:Zn-dependent protease with chaperone function